MPIPSIPLTVRRVSELLAQADLSIAVYGLAGFFVAVAADRLADIAGRRAMPALGGLVSGAGNVLYAYTPSFALFIAPDWPTPKESA